MLDSMRLTPEQQKLVEDNHQLIYWLANRDGLSVDDVYGPFAIGLCKAAHYYDSGKGTFSTFAVMIMRQELIRANNIDYRVKRGGRGLDREGGNKRGLKEVSVVSYDEAVNNSDGNITYKDMLQDDTDYADMAMSRTAAEIVNDLITDQRAKKFIALRLYGYTLDEIAKAHGITRQAVDQVIKRESKKIKAAL